MSKYIGLLRIQRAILALQEWRGRVDSQGAMHLVHFLAAKASGVNSSTYTVHNEDDDRLFCERVLRVRPGTHPYYDPLDDSFRISTHHHSNVATARKKTFADRWHAASYKTDGADELWQFAPDYLAIVRDKVLSKSGVITRVPLYDLCAWLYRAREFPDDISLLGLKSVFAAEYKFSLAEIEAIFSEENINGTRESGNGFFVSERVADELVLKLVENVRDFDATEAISETAQAIGRSPVKIDDIAAMIEQGRRQLILQGPPGTGKTYLAKRVAAKLLGVHDDQEAFERLFIDPNRTLAANEVQAVRANGGWTLVQMHPSYSYEDFVRGIFACLNDGAPSFAVQDRTFAKLCDLGNDASMDLILIIDEVNRADLSKVLGELVYALEYRGEPVSLQYVRDGSSTLKVPRQLVVIGTMNTADHSIAHVDYAIRRRFDFIDVVPDRSVIAECHKDREVLKNNALLLFDAVNELLVNSREQAIGHSFFLGESKEALAQSFVFQVLPLLADYRKEGIIEDSETLGLIGWPGKGIPIYSERPFELVNSLVDWLGQDNAKPS